MDKNLGLPSVPSHTVDDRKTSILGGVQDNITTQRKSSYFSESEGLTLGLQDSEKQRTSKKKINID